MTHHAVLCLALSVLMASQPVRVQASQAQKTNKPWLRRHAPKVSSPPASEPVPTPSEAMEETAPPPPTATTAVETSADEDDSSVMAAQPESAESFPKLPTVSTMLGTASETLKRIEAEVSQVETLEPSKMAKQKAQFEDSLRKQEQENRAVMAVNARITANITSLNTGNDELRKRAKELQHDNGRMRNELHSLEDKIGAAKAFVSASLKSTDDSTSHDLDVLGASAKPTQNAQEAPLHKRHHHGFIQIASDDRDDDSDSDSYQGTAADGADGGDDSNDAGLSFLALSARRATARRASRVEDELGSEFLSLGQAPVVPPPAVDEKQLMQGLSTRVVELGKEEKASEAKLEVIFKADHQAGAKRHEALLAQQKHLKATRKALRELKSKLSIAEAHLKATKQHLEKRLHGLGLFMQKVAHVLLAPPSEAPKLLESLPSEVALAEKL